MPAWMSSTNEKETNSSQRPVIQIRIRYRHASSYPHLFCTTSLGALPIGSNPKSDLSVTGSSGGGTLINNGVGKVIYEDFLPKALEEGVYIAAPDPLVAGKGPEHFQAALELLKKGVSAKKVVVTL